MNSFEKPVVANQSMEFNHKCVSKSLHTVFEDNVDHNIRTLDGSETFHETEVIAAISTPFPGNSVLKKDDEISQGQDITSEVSVNNKVIAIQNYVHPVKPALSSTEIKSFIKLQSPVSLHSHNIDDL